MLLLAAVASLSAAAAVSSGRVLVTGAGGKTGSVVFRKLLELPAYQPIGVVRSKQSAKKLRKSLGDKAATATIAICDVKDSATLETLAQGSPYQHAHGVRVLVFPKLMIVCVALFGTGADAVILCTSAVPKIKLLSLLPVFLNKFFKLLKMQPRRPSFRWASGGTPEEVRCYDERYCMQMNTLVLARYGVITMCTTSGCAD